jgi:hypothetical protein
MEQKLKERNSADVQDVPLSAVRGVDVAEDAMPVSKWLIAALAFFWEHSSAGMSVTIAGHAAARAIAVPHVNAVHVIWTAAVVAVTVKGASEITDM